MLFNWKRTAINHIYEQISGHYDENISFISYVSCCNFAKIEKKFRWKTVWILYVAFAMWLIHNWLQFPNAVLGFHEFNWIEFHMKFHNLSEKPVLSINFPQFPKNKRCEWKMINGIAYNWCARSTSNTFSIYRHLDYQFNYTNFGHRKSEGKRCDVIIRDKRREKCIKQQQNNICIIRKQKRAHRTNSILYDAKRYLIIFKFIQSRVRHHYRFRGKHLHGFYVAVYATFQLVAFSSLLSRFAHKSSSKYRCTGKARDA